MLFFAYVTVNSKIGVIVGPKHEMHWLHPNSRFIVKFLRRKLRKKRTAIAWIKIDCYTGNREDDFVLQLKKELSLYELSMGIYVCWY